MYLQELNIFDKHWIYTASTNVTERIIAID